MFVCRLIIDLAYLLLSTFPTRVTDLQPYWTSQIIIKIVSSSFYCSPHLGFQLTIWPHVLFGLLGLLPGASILSILPQIQSLSLLCTCPNHLSLASLTLSTQHLACTVTLKYTFLILSTHITAKTSLWPSSLLPVCCYLLHTHCWFRYYLMNMFSHSFPPPLPSQVLLEVFPCSFFLTTLLALGFYEPRPDNLSSTRLYFNKIELSLT